jgi:hypothetical protein
MMIAAILARTMQTTPEISYADENRGSDPFRPFALIHTRFLWRAKEAAASFP